MSVGFIGPRDRPAHSLDGKIRHSSQGETDGSQEAGAHLSRRFHFRFAGQSDFRASQYRL